MAIAQDNFNQLFGKLMSVDLFGTAPPAAPWSDSGQNSVQAALDSGANALPTPLATAYLAPLERNLGHVLSALGGDETILETVAGAIYEHADAPTVPALHRFLAVISDLYQSFLTKHRRIQAGFPVVEQWPPVATFQHDGGNGPFTLPVDATKSLFGASVGVVSLPATYQAHPFLWASLSHETGGHDVLHADTPLLPELRQKVQDLFTSSNGQTGDAAFLGQLWAYWMDEAASDVYGIMNIGPSFGANLAVFFTALIAQGSKSDSPVLRSTSGAGADGQLDPHPTDLLRLHLAIGAIQSLAQLDQAIRDSYVQDLQNLADWCSGGATTIELQGSLTIGTGVSRPLRVSLPIGSIQAAASQVGQFIATSKFAALGGHSIQEIETWDDNDEAAAKAIADAHQAGQSVIGAGDDAQLLAGATNALFSKPDLYDAVTAAISAALDHSFEIDPLWGKPQPDPIVFRGRVLPIGDPKLRGYVVIQQSTPAAPRLRSRTRAGAGRR